MDQLLSEQELEKIHVANQCRSYDYIVSQWLKAQDAKSVAARDKEWVEWLLENLFRETDYGLEWQSTPRIALKRLAERKLEIGI